MTFAFYVELSLFHPISSLIFTLPILSPIVLVGSEQAALWGLAVSLTFKIFFLNQWITLLIGAIKNFVLSIKLKNRKILIFKQWNLNAVSFPLRFLTQQCFRKNNSLHKVS